MLRKCSIFLIVFLLALLTTATAAFAAPAGPGLGDAAAELISPVTSGIDWFTVLTTSIGVIGVIAILGWMRKQNFDNIYPNVILMAALLASAFGGVIGVLSWAGLGSIILPLTVVVAPLFFGYAMVYGKRAGEFKGRIAPLNFPALATFFLGLVVLVWGLRAGIEPFVAAQVAAAMAVAAGIVEGAPGMAANAALLVVSPLFVYAGSVIQKFATRDADADETAS